MTFTSSMIVLAVHTEKVLSLLAENEIEVLSRESDLSNSTINMKIAGVTCPDDLRFELVLEHLRLQSISYSHYWEENDSNQGGERHYRSNGNEDQHLSFLNSEKAMVNIEDVREAMTQGETAVLELLEATGNRFAPWDWDEVAA